MSWKYIKVEPNVKVTVRYPEEAEGTTSFKPVGAEMQDIGFTVRDIKTKTSHCAEINADEPIHYIAVLGSTNQLGVL